MTHFASFNKKKIVTLILKIITTFQKPVFSKRIQMPKVCQLPVLHLTISKEELNSRDPLHISKKSMTIIKHVPRKRFSTCTIEDTPKQHASPLNPKPRPPLFNCMTKEAPEMYVCPFCGIKVYLKVNLRVHSEIMHKSSAGVTVETFCQLSDTKYNTNNILKQYTCKNCDFGTFSLLVFLRHVVHHPKNAPRTTLPLAAPWKCNYSKCAFETHHERLLSAHTRSKHLFPASRRWFERDQRPAKTACEGLRAPPRQPEVFACELCPFRSVRKQSWRAHLRWQHWPREGVFKCRHCGYRAKRKHHLQLHTVAKHTPPGDVKWYECEQCPYKAKCRSTLNGHVVARHTALEEISWFVCEQCGFKCKRKFHLKQHMLKHSEDKPLMCEVCSCQFKRLNSLKRHMKKMHKVV